MKALVVGAGAVGQVFALHLSRAGAEVTFAVRSPEKVRSPTTVTRLGAFGSRTASEVAASAIVSSLEGRSFELVVVTVPSDALATPWLASILSGVGDAIVVGLQPGLEDRERLLGAGAKEGRLVRGLISLVSFATPLSKDDPLQTPGYAYWFPPLSPFAFDGPPALVETVVQTLERGGMPAVHRKGLEHEVIFFTAALLVTVRALERHRWSLDALAADPSLSVKASEQALAVTARRLARPVPALPSLTTRPWVLSIGARLAPLVVPFDFETYAKVHFTKVAPQSRLLLGELVKEGKDFELPVDALETLLSGVAAG
ncbi:MAG: hypothetical protein JNJ54_05665 [Myxococcaceae bacterium]|nr:hypothetical protein [Myxococcaceae bacterium]